MLSTSAVEKGIIKLKRGVTIDWFMNAVVLHAQWRYTYNSIYYNFVIIEYISTYILL